MLSEALSFIIAAAWVSIATVVAERLGTRAGGMVATLPSTLVVALFFISVEEGTAFAADVARVVPAEMGVNVVFLALFAMMAHRGLAPALGASLGGWAVLSAILIWAAPGALLVTVPVFVVAAVLMTLWLRRERAFSQVGGQHIAYTVPEIAFRGLLAGAMIAISVAAASLAGPVLGAVLSVFPAIFTSTMVILYLRQGPEFTGATGSVMILGSANVVVYAMLAAWSLPAMGAVAGTVLSLAISYVWSLATYLPFARRAR
jgi:hypothetical protein